MRYGTPCRAMCVNNKDNQKEIFGHLETLLQVLCDKAGFAANVLVIN